MAETPLIFQKIPLIMQDMEAVGKGNTNKSQGWSYRSIDQIKNASNPIFTKHQVFYSPEVLEHTKEVVSTKSGAQMIHHEIKVRYRLFASDGSSVDAIVYGEASDSGDKGLGKAQTYAEKVMLIQVLNIPTEEQAAQDKERGAGGVGSDPDSEAHEIDKVQWKKIENTEPQDITEKIITYGKKYAGQPFKIFNLKGGRNQLRTMVNWMHEQGRDKSEVEKQFIRDAEEFLKTEGPEEAYFRV